MGTSIGVIGGGAWGTALAQMLTTNNTPVMLWAFEEEVCTAINASHRNPVYLPSAALSPLIRATRNLGDLSECDCVLAVTPAQHLRGILSQLGFTPRDLILCSKGIEAHTHHAMNHVARHAVPDSEIAVLSGPTFAHEVAAGLPTAVTLACGGGRAQWDRIAPQIARPAFRPYYSDDVIGAEIGGAVKNVLAIACGVVEGLGLGQNARAALIARGYAEMLRFGDALGAQRDTLAGLCGLGDLVLTCSSTSSRNFSLGKALGEGQNAADLMADRRTVAEGAHTAPVLCEMARDLAVSMPIADAVNELLQGAAAATILERLLARPLTAEVAHP